MRRKGELGVNIVFIIEGEEEVSSEGFLEAVEEQKEWMGEIDLLLISNNYWLDDENV